MRRPRRHLPVLIVAGALAVAPVVTARAAIELQDLTFGSTAIRGGTYEASGAIAVPGTTGALFVDDDDPVRVWWLEFDEHASQRGPARSVPLALGVSDPEGITTDGTYFYVTGSTSRRDKNGPYDLVRFRFDPRTGRADDVEGVRGLARFLARHLAGGAGRQNRVRPGALNVEGLAWDGRSGRLLFGLREPVDGTSALVVAVRLQPGAPLDLDAIADRDVETLRIPLGGFGIRGLGHDGTSGRFYVLAGPPGDANGVPFRLLRWDGRTGSTPAEIRRLPAVLKPEGVTTFELGGRTRTLVVCDVSRFLFVD